MAQAKHWVFTVFSDEVSFFDHDKVLYCIFGNEKCPKTGRWHKQGYVCFKNRVRMPFLKTLDGTAHWEMKRGSVKEAVDYCKKDGDYYQYGELPVEERKRQANKFKVVRDLVKQGKYEELENGPYYGTYIRYKKAFDSFERQYEDLPEPRGIWVYGQPGTDKDTAVINKYKPFVKTHDKWWDGYRDEENVLWSDFDPDEMKYFENYFRQWADRYPFTAEHKGGSRRIHPKRFIVTSNHSIEQLFLGDVQEKALKRRFEEVDCDNKIVTKRPKIDFVNEMELIDF